MNKIAEILVPQKNIIVHIRYEGDKPKKYLNSEEDSEEYEDELEINDSYGDDDDDEYEDFL